MVDRYKFHRDFADILVNAPCYKDLPGVEYDNAVLRFIANSKVMKIIFGGLYATLVEKKEMKSLEEQSEEYKAELWNNAKELMPDRDQDEKIEYCRCVMGFLWLLNN